MQKNSSTILFVFFVIYSILAFAFSRIVSISYVVTVGLWFLPLLALSFMLNVKATLIIALMMINGISLTSNLTVSQFTLFIPFMILILFFEKKDLFQLKGNYLTLPFFLYMVSFLVTFLFTKSKSDSINWHLIGVQFLIIYLFLTEVINNKRTLIMSGLALGSSFLITLYYGLRQFSSGVKRVSVNVNNPNEAAGYLAFYFFLFVTIAFSVRNRTVKLVSGILAFLSLFLLMATYSRGGQLAVFAAILLYSIIKLSKLGKKKIIYVSAVGGSVILLFLIFIGSSYLSRFSDISSGSIDGSTLDRFGLWYSAFRLFLDSPIVGVGVNNFKNLYLEYHPLYGIMPIQKHFVAHNYLLNTLAEQGIIGVVALITLHFAVAKKLFLMVKNIKTGLYREVTISLAAYYVYIILHNSLDTYWTSYGHINSHFIIAIYLAFITIVDNLNKRSNEKYNYIS